jgi:predicted RNA-binding protein with PUA-like domain
MAESAFNPAAPYYDPKSSRDNPKWELVHVRFVRKFPELVPLSQLKKYGQPGGALQDLEMLKQSRLSVSAVKPEEWHFIVGLARDEDANGQPEEGAAAARGQMINDRETVNGYDGDSGNEAAS